MSTTVSRGSVLHAMASGVFLLLLATGAWVAAHEMVMAGMVMAAPLAAQGDFAGLVDIGGGRRMYLECRGEGGPTVILVAGYGNHGGVWSLQSPEVPQPPVLPAVAGFS